MFPGGQQYTNQGKKYRVSVRGQIKGSMTSEILQTVFKTLGTLKIFDWSTSITPVMLFYWYDSRLQLTLLEYINNVEHPWAAIIGVPYDISLWQVGDSKEQNGAYKMVLARKKKKSSNRKK